MNQRPYTKFLLAGISAAAVLIGAQVAWADVNITDDDDDGVSYENPFDGDFTNSANITNTGTDADGVDFKGAFGSDPNGTGVESSFTNSGTITGNLRGVRFYSTFDGNFKNEGSITGKTKRGVFFRGAFGRNTVSSFTNEGNIYGADTGVNFTGAFDGNFTNSASGSIEGGETGVEFHSTFDGNFKNEGDITGEIKHGVYFGGEFGSDPNGTGVESSFTNSGTITGGYDGAQFLNAFTGNFTNSAGGTITGDDEGVQFSATFDGDFKNEGDITGGDNGAQFHNAFDGDFTNEGNITTSATGHALWVGGDFTGDLINTGNISGTSTAAGTTNYIYIGGDFTGNMTQPVGVRVDVGDYVDDEGNGNGTANLSGDYTYSVHVDGFVDDGYGWEAIRAGKAVNLGNEADLEYYEPIDNSFLVSFVRDNDKSTGNILFLKVKKDDNDNRVSDVSCGDYGLAQEADDAINGSYADMADDEMRRLADLLYSAGTADDVAAVIGDYSPVSGAGHGVLGNSQQVTDQLADRLRPNNANGAGAWGSVFGGTGDFDTCSGYDTVTAGVIGGFEGPVNKTTKVGMAISHLYANVDGKNSLAGDEANISSLGPAFYARYQPDGIDGVEG